MHRNEQTRFSHNSQSCETNRSRSSLHACTELAESACRRYKALAYRVKAKWWIALRRDSHSRSPTTKEFGARSIKKLEPCYLESDNPWNTRCEMFYRGTSSRQHNKEIYQNSREIAISKLLKWNTVRRCIIGITQSLPITRVKY